jgi:hypothetical protein
MEQIKANLCKEMQKFAAQKIKETSDFNEECASTLNKVNKTVEIPLLKHCANANTFLLHYKGLPISDETSQPLQEITEGGIGMYLALLDIWYRNGRLFFQLNFIFQFLKKEGPTGLSQIERGKIENSFDWVHFLIISCFFICLSCWNV